MWPDTEHDFKYSVFKVVIYLKFFLVLKSLTGQWLVGPWSLHLVGGWWSVIGWLVGRWSVSVWF